MTKFQQYARDNYKPGGQRDEMWHDAVIAECDVIDAEAIAKREAERARIRAVVEKTADIGAELAGRIVVKVKFDGSHAKKKALTRDEKKLVMTLPADVKTAIGGDKPLFECKEYDELMKFIADRRDQFSRFGIPHIQFEAAHVTDINNIPEIEELAEKTEAELFGKVSAFIVAWPAAIEKAQADLGPLFNKNDYMTQEALGKLFRFSYNWMAFGVPDELKQFNPQIYAKAKAKAEKVWAEIEANGVALLRETVADLVGGLAESLTPKDGGEKKKFYPSSVEKITDFIESFKKRNICNDVELEAEVEKLSGLVRGIDVAKLSAGDKGDQRLRETVRAQMEEAKGSLDQLLVSASARVMRLRD